MTKWNVTVMEFNVESKIVYDEYFSDYDEAIKVYRRKRIEYPGLYSVYFNVAK